MSSNTTQTNTFSTQATNTTIAITLTLAGYFFINSSSVEAGTTTSQSITVYAFNSGRLRSHRIKRLLVGRLGCVIATVDPLIFRRQCIQSN